MLNEADNVYRTTRLQNSIARQSEDAKPVLENCKDFCSAAAAAQQYAHITAILNFIHKANDEDDWLLPASQIIFPSLITIYSSVLRTSDPDKKKMSPRPGSLNLAITMTVKKNKEALRALCSIFDLCVDFCEVDWNETKKHLATFAKAAAAVLFGSNFQRERDTLNDTDYAMDELARYSSFALSHILLTKPSLIGDASKILGKRIPTLLTCLFSSPELSIQRSIILVVRLLYDNAKEADTVPSDLKRRIENGLSVTHFGNGFGLDLFKSFNVSSDDSETQGEQVLSKMFEENDISSRCFGCQCTVQMKGKVNGRIKKGGSLKASVDWNKNSIVVHVRNQDPAYFPLYTISTMKWIGSHKELQLAFRADSALKETQLVVQFKPGNRGYLGRAIEQRIQRLLSLAMEHRSSLQEVDGLEQDRKASTAYHQLGAESPVDDDPQCKDEGTSDEGAPEDAGHGAQQNSDQDEDMSPHQPYHENEQIVKPVADNDNFPVQAEDEPTIFSNLAADGVLRRDQVASQWGVARPSPESEETKEKSEATSLDSGDVSPAKPRAKPRTPPHERVLDNAKVVGKSTRGRHTKTIKLDEEIIETLVMNEPSARNLGGELSLEVQDSQRDRRINEPEKSQPVSGTPFMSDPSWDEGGVSDKSQPTNTDDVVMQDVDEDGPEKPVASKSRGKNSNNHSVAFKRDTTFRKTPVADSNGESEESTVASIHSDASEVSKSSLCEDDEGMRVKLLSVICAVMKVRFSSAWADS